MIVNCPNCSLEQPLDPFCAGCGKQLPKLIAEHKKKMKLRNKRTQKIIILSLAFFSLSFYVYYAYQNPGARPFAQSTPKNTVKLMMPKGTITASKFKAKNFTESLKVKSFTVVGKKLIKDKPALAPFKKIIPAKKLEKPSIKLKEFFVLDVEPCTEGDVETGPLSQDELSFFLECSTVVLKLNDGETVDIDPNLPFANSISLKMNKTQLTLKLELAVDGPPIKSSSSIKLAKPKPATAGQIIKIAENRSIANYIADRALDSPSEMLESYALSRTLKLSPEGKPAPKGYFLAVFE